MSEKSVRYTGCVVIGSLYSLVFGMLVYYWQLVGNMAMLVMFAVLAIMGTSLTCWGMYKLCVVHVKEEQLRLYVDLPSSDEDEGL